MGQIQRYPLTVRLSRIHGKGLYASEDIQAGTIIYESDEYTTTPFPIYGSIQHTRTEHLLEDFLRWENHSCQPNTCLRFAGPIVELIATTSVPAGEEIVCDYRTTEDAIPAPFRCNCGHCAGIIIR